MAKTQTEDTTDNGWVGVDLDGTLAHYDGWHGIEHIGKPIPKMVANVKKAIEKGEVVKIFTARMDTEGADVPIRKWLKAVGLPDDLEITNVKDRHMAELWDDRARQVIPNTGKFLDEHITDAVLADLDGTEIE